MKRLWVILSLVFLILNTVPSLAEEERVVIYFYSDTCLTCQQVSPKVDLLENQGIQVIRYDVSQYLPLFERYIITYGMKLDDYNATVPLLFVGEHYFNGEDILTALEDGTILQLSTTPPIDPISEEEMERENHLSIDLNTVAGVFTVLGAGLIDGFNPCAIAMMLLFISLLGFTKKRRMLITVSFTYIFALFITYFLLGTLLFQFIHFLSDEIRLLTTILSYLMIVLALFLFGFNLYDFFMSKNKQYDQVKNQLPKKIQAWNRKITEKITSYFEETNNTRFITIIALTFSLGVVISLTEFMCTGQIYLPIIVSLVQFNDTFSHQAILLLLGYNLMFVLPLIIISIIAIKTQSIMATSNKVREHLHWIKLGNAGLFLFIALFYLVRLI